MERAMKAFEEDADQAKRYIEAEWRKERWGHKPERPLRGNSLMGTRLGPSWQPLAGLRWRDGMRRCASRRCVLCPDADR